MTRLLVALSAAVATAIALISGAANATTACSVASKAGDLCFCKVLTLRPTQFAVGMIEVKDKALELASKSEPKLNAYQQKHPELVVMGPKGDFFIIDRHHLALAMATDGIESTYCHIKADYSGLDAGVFWTKMAAQHWTYLYDEKGDGPLSPKDLPSTVEGLRDDPYRSLAGAVRDGGSIAKTSLPFAEFAWANYFRSSGISVADIQAHFDGAVKEASVIATEQGACSLPGYEGGSKCKQGTTGQHQAGAAH